MSVLLIICCMFGIRLLFLSISIQNERKILNEGGKEYGQTNTKYLTLLHILFYVSCFIEALFRSTALDKMGYIGIGLLLFSIIMLSIVVSLLGELWTVKLMLVQNHQFVDHWLFRTIKHPNYFLNIIPELIGLTLLGHAFYTFIFLSPFYAFVLYLRIDEENALLNNVIIPNSRKK